MTACAEEVTQRTVALCVEAHQALRRNATTGHEKGVGQDTEGSNLHKPRLHHGKQNIRQLMKHNTDVLNI